MKRFLIVVLLLAGVYAIATKADPYGYQSGIPILMFHRFSSTSTSLYSVKPLEFKAMLKVLNSDKYCMIDLLEYTLASFLKRCAKKKVFAISFDDGHASQFRFLKNGKLDPNSGLGVLLGVFPQAKATFFLNVTNGGAPFGQQSQQKIAFLRAKGLNIGNHTVSHPDMSKLSNQAVIREIDGVCQYFGQSSMILAYPYGFMPPKSITTYQTKCRVPAAFRAWLGYFEGERETIKTGSLLAPLPNTPEFSSRRLTYPRFTISSFQDFQRDIMRNYRWQPLP